MILSTDCVNAPFKGRGGKLLLTGQNAISCYEYFYLLTAIDEILSKQTYLLMNPQAQL